MRQELDKNMFKKVNNAVLRAQIVLGGMFLGTVVIVFLLTSNDVGKQARTINKTGVVRGLSQRVIKLEFAGAPNALLIERVDRVIQGLIDGDKELQIPKIETLSIRAKMVRVVEAWEEIKLALQKYRENPNKENRAKLLLLSESFWAITNSVVDEKEFVVYTQQITTMQWQLVVLVVDMILIVLAFITTKDLAQFSKYVVSAEVEHLMNEVQDSTDSKINRQKDRTASIQILEQELTRLEGRRQELQELYDQATNIDPETGEQLPPLKEERNPED